MNSAAFFAAIGADTMGWFMLAAVVGKLSSFAAFRDNLSTSFGLPPPWAAAAAPLLGAAEAIAAALLLGGQTRLGMSVALLMLVLFTSVLAYMRWRDGAVRCSCFGEAQRTVSPFDLQRNVLVIAMGASSLMAAPPSLPTAPSLLVAALALSLSILAVGYHDFATLLMKKEH